MSGEKVIISLERYEEMRDKLEKTERHRKIKEEIGSILTGRFGSKATYKDDNKEIVEITIREKDLIRLFKFMYKNLDLHGKELQYYLETLDKEE